MAVSVTLAEIERALGLRVGPYRRLAVWIGSVNLLQVRSLKSTLTTGQWEDLYLLRRGKKLDGTAVPAFSQTDRIRVVAAYDNTNGGLTPDQPWTTAPVVDEVIELHHLDPEHELRPSVQEGLKRCFFEDAVDVATTGSAAERNLTTTLGWLTDPDQVRGVEIAALSGRDAPSPLAWHTTYQKGGDVWLRGAPDPYPQALKVRVLRPASSYVNGVTSTTGPQNDDDTVIVDVLYAARAAHLAAWELFPARLRAAAEAGLALTAEQVAARFSLLSRRHVRTRAGTVGFDEPFTFRASEARAN